MNNTTYAALQAQIAQLLDAAANDRSAGGMVGLGSVWLAAELFALNEQVCMAQEKEDKASESEVSE